jgi:hypothetical protein
MSSIVEIDVSMGEGKVSLRVRCVLFWFSLGAECDRECGWVIQSGQDLCIALSKKKRSVYSSAIQVPSYLFI